MKKLLGMSNLGYAIILVIISILLTVIVTFFAGMGAGLGTGFAGLSIRLIIQI